MRHKQIDIHHMSNSDVLRLPFCYFQDTFYSSCYTCARDRNMRLFSQKNNNMEQLFDDFLKKLNIRGSRSDIKNFTKKFDFNNFRTRFFDHLPAISRQKADQDNFITIVLQVLEHFSNFKNPSQGPRKGRFQAIFRIIIY